MLQNKEINVFYRIVCLIVFVFVVFKINNFITLALLTIAFYLFTKDENSSFVSFWHLITIIIFLISYFTKNYIILRIALMIDLCYYFLSVSSDDTMVMKKKTIVVDKYFLRFARNNNIRKDIVNNNSLCTMYVCVHMFILFIIIVVGSCAI